MPVGRERADKRHVRNSGLRFARVSTDPQLRNHAAFIWSVADKLRGVYKQSEYGRVILPLVVLRRGASLMSRRRIGSIEKAPFPGLFP